MKHNEGHFQGTNNIELFYQSWQPEQTTQAKLIIIHGFGEHSGRYPTLIDQLVPNGYAIYAFDHRGHGRSPGQRGFVKQFADFRGDVRAFVQLVISQEPHAPLFIFGHSMGGLITLDYVLHYPDHLSGVIVSGPAIGPTGVSPILKFLAKILANVWPTLSIDAGLDDNAISRDPAEIEMYKNDPLVHGKGSPRLATEVEKAAEWVQTHAADLKLPILITQGEADRLTPPAGSQRFFQNLTCDDKAYILYPNGYHESHNDLHRQQAVDDIETWLEKHRA